MGTGMTKPSPYVLLACGLLSSCGAEQLSQDSDNNRNEAIDDFDGEGGAGTGGIAVGGAATGGFDVGGGGAGGAGPENVCAPGAAASCYSGPPGTEGVGVCVPGTQICADDGMSWGPCIGEVVPSEETCALEGDEDCDGEANEGGIDCSVQPWFGHRVLLRSTSHQERRRVRRGHPDLPTLTAPATVPCVGETLPQLEDCNTPADEDCDGVTPACPEAVVDLRVDNNRNGSVELNAASEDTNEHLWDANSGAVFLANIDDDQNACPTSGSDSALASCHDANDNYVNGSDDLLDLARIKTVPWPDAPNDASAYLTVSSPGSNHVRLFKKSGNSWSVYVPGTTFSATEIQAGVELAIEGTDVIRDDGIWNGLVDLTLTVDGGTGPDGPIGGGSDIVRMRQAPMLFRHHNDPVTTYYVTHFSSTDSQLFRDDLATAAAATSADLINVYENDQWTQDFFETAYMAMPAIAGHHVVHVNVRSANYTGQLRSAGRVGLHRSARSKRRGCDRVRPQPQQLDGHAELVRQLGDHPSLQPQRTRLATGAGVARQRAKLLPRHALRLDGPVTGDAGHRLHRHVVVAGLPRPTKPCRFVKANTPRGWVMLVNDATMAKNMLEQQQSAGYGNVDMFVGKYWSGFSSAQVSISEVLADTDVMNESAWAAVKVDDQVADIVAATGLTSSEMVAVPFLHWETSGWSVAYQPGTVNGIYMADDVFGAPDPHGPVINGQDIFKSQLVSALAPYGIDVYWIENWDLYHRLLGEVHCGTNATRAVPASTKWWESGL